MIGFMSITERPRGRKEGSPRDRYKFPFRSEEQQSQRGKGHTCVGVDRCVSVLAW